MAIKLQDLTSQLNLETKGFKAGATAAIAGVAAIVAGITIAVKATMDWAADLDGLGDVMDGTSKDFAAIGFVARKSGVGVDKFTKANVILEKSLLKANGTLDTSGKKLKEYGINVKDANGNVKTSIQLTDEIAQKFGKLATQQEKVNFLTEIYGKQGADLIDFFDTLAQEGGIDKVTKKVEALGLAIDPARYEQFNRNLEELKLVGLGLAVSFTEKLMPTLERFLGWLSKTAQSPKFKEIKQKVSDMLDTLFGDKSKSADSLFDLKNRGAVKVNTSAWRDVGKTIGDAIATGVKGVINPAFWKSVTTIDPKEANNIASFLEGLTGISRTVQVGSAQDPIANLVRGWIKNLDDFEVRTTDKIRNFFNNLEKKGTEGVRRFITGLVSGFGTGSSSFIFKMNELEAKITDKMTQIAKTFFNRAAGWGAQMLQGFVGSQGALLSKISGMVGEINSILRKIITSFNLTITFSDPTSAGTSGGRPGGGSTGGGGGGHKRATGGAVMAGQTYDVAEFNRPERFTPNQSGRVDPIKEQRITVDINYNKLARALAPVLLKNS